MLEDWIMVTGMVCIVLGGTAALLLGIATIDYHLHKYPVEITQNGEVVYEGIMSCVVVQSGGDTTTITIRKGFLCLFPKETIVGRGIEVKTK